MTPMGLDAEFRLEKSSNGHVVSCKFFDGQRERTIAVTNSVDTTEDFIWLVECAAAFHKIPVKRSFK